MLVRFTFKNTKSFLDEQVFTMEARPDKEFAENTVTVSKELLPGNEGILKTAIIFGANASGKSNLIKAIDYMKRAVLLSGSAVDIIRMNDTFAFREGADRLDSHYEVEFIENGSYYRYGFVLRERKVVKEWLFRRAERLTPLFKREGEKLSITGLSPNEGKLIAPSEKTLFISIAENLKLSITPEIRDVLSFFRRICIIMRPERESLSYYLENSKYLEDAIRILKDAGTGIADLSVIKDGTYIDAEASYPVFKENGEVARVRKVRIFQDPGLVSTGTVKLICMLAQLLKAADNGETVFLNDFGAYLHVQVAKYILTLFNNSQGSQLIATSQVSLLMDRGMRRDQIWFTSKDGFERSTLLPLYSFGNVRKSDAYSKRYLSGEYTAQLPLVL